MKITAQQIAKACKGKPNLANLASYIEALNGYGQKIGLDQPQRSVQLTAQVMHESAEFRYDHEIWGPTPAQKRYDTRTDLGNTAALDGDGYKNRGRGPLQLTGATNIKAFYAWCKKVVGGKVPNFPANPDLINTDPWEGLSALWYWDSHGLNRYADAGNVEMVTRRINGGLNGFAERCGYFTRLALVMLGYPATDVRGFQRDHGITADGLSGPQTRAVLNRALIVLGKQEAVDAPEKPPAVDPVTGVPADRPAVPVPTSGGNPWVARAVSAAIALAGTTALVAWNSVADAWHALINLIGG